MTTIRHPEITVQLTGQDGNAYSVLARMNGALRQAGHADEIDDFMAEATASDYDHLLATCMAWVDVA